MDKSWMKLSRTSKGYRKGLQNFLDFAFSNSIVDGMILCPCKVCKNGISLRREDVEVHLRCDGFIKDYTQWIAHGERSFYNETTPVPNASCDYSNPVDNIEELVHDAFGIQNEDVIMEDDSNLGVEEPNVEARKFYKLLHESQQKLCPGCKKFSKLSFLIRLLHLKCLGKMSDKIFAMLLDLLRAAALSH